MKDDDGEAVDMLSSWHKQFAYNRNNNSVQQCYIAVCMLCKLERTCQWYPPQNLDCPDFKVAFVHQHCDTLPYPTI